MQDEIQKFKEDILKNQKRLKPDSRFKFSCQPGVTCFNQCCRDVNILLTPYDVLRLKNRLGISSGEFLKKYTILPFGPEQKLPFPLLKMNEDDEKKCLFVDDEKGCTVYSDRPWPCRMYPLGQASPSEDSEEEEFYFLLEEEICKGFESEKEYSVEGWQKDQGVEDYDELGTLFKEITLHPTIQQGQPLDPKQTDMYFTACYDLDKFRRFLVETSFFDKFEVEQETIDKIQKDDVELLKFGFRWLKFCILKQTTLKVKEDVIDAKKKEFS